MHRSRWSDPERRRHIRYAGPDSAQQARKELSLRTAGWCWLACLTLIVAGIIWGIVGR